MAVDTIMAYAGVYSDAAVVERRADGKVKIAKHHETPTRVAGLLGGGIGLATGVVVALFPFAAIGGGLLVATAGGGAALGEVAGQVVAGMSRGDSRSWVSTWMPARLAWSWSGSRTWAPRSSGPCGTPRSWRPGSSGPTPTRSNATPRPPAPTGGHPVAEPGLVDPHRRPWLSSSSRMRAKRRAASAAAWSKAASAWASASTRVQGAASSRDV
jgi:hypothetical protein